MSPDYVKAIEGGVHPTQTDELIYLEVTFSRALASRYYRNENLRTKMADLDDLRTIQCQQLAAMDSIQYHREHSRTILQCFEFSSRYDEHDIHDNGLRFAVIVGAIGTTIGAWIKVFSVSPDLFWITFIGHTFVAVSQTFVLSVPARLAAVWFGPDQVSSACSIGVFGNQLGIAIGFLFPPILVPNSDDLAVVARGFQIMFYIVAAFTSLILVVILLFFKAQPPLPPSPAQAVQRENDSTEDFIQSIKRLFTNVGYLLLLLSYAINVGIFYAISTLLNQIILEYFPGHEEDAGRIGLTIICAGMLGSVVCGIILDKTHKYKFFMTGYLPVGFELAAELTYPEPEGTAAGLLNAVTQVFGIIFTILYGNLIKLLSNLWANIVLCVALAIGAFLTTIIPNDLRRQNAKF
ncbi:hypothetical protein HZH68_008859 [Vespula germanica]|uniref:Feline leukemia virus subgroup C receptor-related protein 2 n=1 Tax=Vespula germanica TaxID=30212 RepID=A0A834N642_VESGE|nr:hypothetical protein HZH68_008859 [Vespula germanica]